jgi:transcriptional regulator with XRE-family HTH domain
MARTGPKPPDPNRLFKLTELREQKGLTLEQMARLCGLPGSQSRKMVGRWEQGLSVPQRRRAPGMRNYLLDGLGLHQDRVLFRQIWDVLVEEWEWEPSTDPEPGEAPDGGGERSRPPQLVDFVGRDRELVYFAERLKSTNLAVVTGMAGVGKTALAAELARWVADADQVFWHSFRQGEGVNAVIFQSRGGQSGEIHHT